MYLPLSFLFVFFSRAKTQTNKHAYTGSRITIAPEDDVAGKEKLPRIPVPPTWRQVVSTAAGFMGVLLVCIYGSRMVMVPPTVAVGGFYFILGGALLVPLQAASVRCVVVWC